MGDETKKHPKCLTVLADGQTILARQLRHLAGAGVHTVVITTGLFEKQLRAQVAALGLPLEVQFVYNPAYAETNYIYSIYLARDLVDDDLLLLHGDLVFDNDVLTALLASPVSAMAVHRDRPLPEKDFKAEIQNGFITRVGVALFENAVAAQPLYRLTKEAWRVWLNAIELFVERGETSVYAENAFNTVSDTCKIRPYDVSGCLCDEIDTPEDWAAINEIIIKAKEGAK